MEMGLPPDQWPEFVEVPSSYRLPFLDQRITLDLRDNTAQPTRGAYFRLAMQEAARLWEPSWNYVRITPEARGYAPLGLGMVLAARFAIGALYIFDASRALDEESRVLGPQAYRMRGGGAQSNRGFAPGRLGTGYKDNPLSGGIRRWESSLEWRIPLAESFGIVLFADVGDVNAKPNFRFDHLNTAVGAGLRYRTIIGPIRFDVAGRPEGAQMLDGSPPSDATMDLGFVQFRGAVHLTIGEAF
jgi:outer membrane translocation and assembly module TamA